MHEHVDTPDELSASLAAAARAEDPEREIAGGATNLRDQAARDATADFLADLLADDPERDAQGAAAAAGSRRRGLLV